MAKGFLREITFSKKWYFHAFWLAPVSVVFLDWATDLLFCPRVLLLKTFVVMKKLLCPTRPTPGCRARPGCHRALNGGAGVMFFFVFFMGA
ncbi:MAG TPA: hypothetical protein VF490_08230 [Chryseosolibacter sp.]